MNICIIPARGGSKRIPGKNIRSFHGKPIIAYSIEAALASGCFRQVMVSTDSDEIAAIAQAFGATFCKRPEALADDHVGTQAVMREALIGRTMIGDNACCIYATAPMMTPEDLRVGERALISTSWDPTYAFSVTTYSFPLQRALRRNASGALSAVWEDEAQARSQDLEEYWHDAGQWYWGRASAFIRDEPLYSPAAIGVPIPRWRVQDIDTEDDWIRAELMYAAMKGRP